MAPASCERSAAVPCSPCWRRLSGGSGAACTGTARHAKFIDHSRRFAPPRARPTKWLIRSVETPEAAVRRRVQSSRLARVFCPRRRPCDVTRDSVVSSLKLGGFEPQAPWLSSILGRESPGFGGYPKERSRDGNGGSDSRRAGLEDGIGGRWKLRSGGTSSQFAKLQPPWGGGKVR